MSVVLLATTLSLAQLGLASRSFILDLENKRISEKLAEACVQTARINVYNNPFYESDAPVVIPVGITSCTIVSVRAKRPEEDQSEINISSTYKKSITNFIIVVNTTNADIISWKEVSKF